MASDTIGDNAPRVSTNQPFTRLEPSPVSPFARSRTTSDQSLMSTEYINSTQLSLSMSGDDDQDAGPDLFEKMDSTDTSFGGVEQQAEQTAAPDQSEELPIELISLTDR